MADEDENNNKKVKKFGAHSVAHESSEDLNSKELSENSEYIPMQIKIFLKLYFYIFRSDFTEFIWKIGKGREMCGVTG